ncbi:rhodanese-like domain-containing protein [Streptomyces bobili]|uniref:rhodanese-like domain-containing protein n=1 Tax=Streptomyces bobili TaxID=67280 RepID=UPI0034175433
MVLDIRQRAEHATGHIPGAVGIERAELTARSDEAPAGAVVACGHGERAKRDPSQGRSRRRAQGARKLVWLVSVSRRPRRWRGRTSGGCEQHPCRRQSSVTPPDPCSPRHPVHGRWPPG